MSWDCFFCYWPGSHGHLHSAHWRPQNRLWLLHISGTFLHGQEQPDFICLPFVEMKNNVLLDRYMSNHLSEPVCIPKPPQDQVHGHVDCEQNNANVLLQRYLPNHLRRQLWKSIVYNIKVLVSLILYAAIMTCGKSEIGDWYGFWNGLNIKHLPIIIMIINGGNMPMTKTHLTS